jgi:hypothetical protein
MPYLQAAAASDLDHWPPPCRHQRVRGQNGMRLAVKANESPLELRLLKAIRAAGLPEPVKQHKIYDSRGRLLTRAAFAYLTPKRIRI